LPPFRLEVVKNTWPVSNAEEKQTQKLILK